MKVLELFAGTRSIGKAFEAHGHEVYSVDWSEGFEGIDLRIDIGKLTAQEVLERFGRPDVIWASPDCATFSVAAIGHHRRKDKATGTLIPQTDYAAFCDEVNRHVLDLIAELDPKWWFVENPRGGMRSMDYMRGLPRHTVTYCKYGERRMKPTDIWTNHPDPRFIPPCKNGDPCHERAPRGSRTGTQGIQGSIERAILPPALCEHIVRICEEGPAPRGKSGTDALDGLWQQDSDSMWSAYQFEDDESEYPALSAWVENVGSEWVAEVEGDDVPHMRYSFGTRNAAMGWASTWAAT